MIKLILGIEDCSPGSSAEASLGRLIFPGAGGVGAHQALLDTLGRFTVRPWQSLGPVRACWDPNAAQTGWEGAMPSEVTLQELGELIRREIAGGYASTEKQEGRKRLLDVVDELATVVPGSADGADAGLLDSRVWCVAEVRLASIGGVGELEPPAMTFSPVPGVTVIRGLNGQGKTSVARGIDCALRGELDAPEEVAGELWTADLLAEGAESASVAVVLVSGSARLEITASFAPSAAPEVDALLHEHEETRRLAITQAWRDALAGAHAYYSYGALQSRLIATRDLQTFLEELLVLGPVWERVRATVTSRSEQALTAKRIVENAGRDAQRREAALRAHHQADERGPAPLPPVSWPRVKDGVDIDAWLEDVDLVAMPAEVVRVSSSHEERGDELRTALQEADADLDAAESGLDSPGMAAAVHHIEALLGLGDLDAATCPVCGSVADWRDHAREIAGGLQHRSRAAGRVKAAVTAVRDWVEGELMPLLAVDVGGSPGAEVSAFRAATPDGCHAHSTAHVLAWPVLERLNDDQYREWLSKVREMSDATAEWRSALDDVVRDFASQVRGHTLAGAGAGAWRKAQDTLDELQLRMRQDRQDSVTEELRSALARMLPDAVVDLTTIQHQGGIKQRRGVEVAMTIGGRSATLGMLSSGQRNALLLTPLAVVHDGSPFGFLIVDDPVHALDDTRVDLLADELVGLSDHKQVIVLTHDPRLEEHLRARRPDTTVLELQRDPVDRRVTWSRLSQPWQSLLADAREIVKGAESDGWGYSESLASVVAGLCRDAVDGALRQSMITRAVVRGEDVEDALAELNRADRTARRIAQVMTAAGGPESLPALEAGRVGHLLFWNQGSHGQLPAGVDLLATIVAAEMASAEVTTHDWSTG